VFLVQTRQFLIQMFVVDLRLRALGPVGLPNPSMSRIFMDSKVAGCLGHRVLRLDRQLPRALLKFGRLLLPRCLTHRTHLSSCVMSLVSVCPEEYSHFT
jgi:hypothetical protein